MLFTKTTNIFLLFWQKMSKDNIILYSQGLTYNTLLTFIPLLGLILSLSRSFFNEDYIIQQSFQFFSKYLKAEVLNSVITTIDNILENLKKFPLGRFSLLLYFFMSIGLLFQIEDILNKIFLSYQKRTLKEKILFYFITITFAPFIFMLPLLLQKSISTFENFQILLYFVFLFLFFYLIYLYFPARKISKIATLQGAFFTTLLWYSTSFLFGLYVKKAVSYSKLYGSLSVIPIFLLFIFTNWLIFLIGAEITYFIEKKPWSKKDIIKIPLFEELIIMYYLTQKFYQKETISIKGLEKEMPFLEEQLHLFISNLEKKNFITVKDEEIFFRVPPEKIRIKDIIEESRFLYMESIMNKKFFEKNLRDLIKEAVLIENDHNGARIYRGINSLDSKSTESAEVTSQIKRL